jgi:hypothetical protein
MDGPWAATAAVEADWKERGNFQGRFGFGRRPAVVLIDMADAWPDPAHAGGPDRLDAAAFALEWLVPAAQAKGVPGARLPSTPFMTRKTGREFSG